MNEKLINDMLDKSEEAFLIAIEIYNKPTINYRLEGYIIQISLIEQYHFLIVFLMCLQMIKILLGKI